MGYTSPFSLLPPSLFLLSFLPPFLPLPGLLLLSSSPHSSFSLSLPSPSCSLPRSSGISFKTRSGSPAGMGPRTRRSGAGSGASRKLQLCAPAACRAAPPRRRPARWLQVPARGHRQCKCSMRGGVLGGGAARLRGGCRCGTAGAGASPCVPGGGARPSWLPPGRLPQPGSSLHLPDPDTCLAPQHPCAGPGPGGPRTRRTPAPLGPASAPSGLLSSAEAPAASRPRPRGVWEPGCSPRRSPSPASLLCLFLRSGSGLKVPHIHLGGIGHCLGGGAGGGLGGTSRCNLGL